MPCPRVHSQEESGFKVLTWRPGTSLFLQGSGLLGHRLPCPCWFPSSGQCSPSPVVYFRFLYTCATLIIAFTSAGECCLVGGRGTWRAGQVRDRTPQRPTGSELEGIPERSIAGLWKQFSVLRNVMSRDSGAMTSDSRVCSKDYFFPPVCVKMLCLF